MPQARPRRRTSTDDRRYQLLIGAQLFAEKPCGGVWIAEVADRAGVSED
ncbi:MAG: hypothetical protein ACRDQ7_09930 [Haloechinothrix sp.]